MNRGGTTGFEFYPPLTESEDFVEGGFCIYSVINLSPQHACMHVGERFHDTPTHEDEAKNFARIRRWGEIVRVQCVEQSCKQQIRGKQEVQICIHLWKK